MLCPSLGIIKKNEHHHGIAKGKAEMVALLVRSICTALNSTEVSVNIADTQNGQG